MAGESDECDAVGVVAGDHDCPADDVLDVDEVAERFAVGARVVALGDADLGGVGDARFQQ